MTSRAYLCIASVLLVFLGGCIASVLPTNETVAPPTSENLQLSDNSDSNRKHEKKEGNVRAPPTSVAASPSSGDDDSSAVLYKLPGEGGDSCILLSVDAIVEFKYTTTLNERMEKDTFIPGSATINGDCTGDDQQSFILRWKTFVLIFYFSKTPGGESWFVEKIELKYDSSDHHQFEHIKNPGRTYTLTSSNKGLLFPTPVGKSYKCKEISVDLVNPKVTDTTATLLLRQFKMEPFIFKKDFGPEFFCSPGGIGSYRSETAPLIVGSILAATCLSTITGYAIFRYFKIKKVQYDTME